MTTITAYTPTIDGDWAHLAELARAAGPGTLTLTLYCEENLTDASDAENIEDGDWAENEPRPPGDWETHWDQLSISIGNARATPMRHHRFYGQDSPDVPRIVALVTAHLAALGVQVGAELSRTTPFGEWSTGETELHVVLALA